ncbi:DUF4091 domain-containing protein [Nocardioides sp. YIM 152315]|uniref:DUF4091 domain-containing protein n=1 Tax=Nocardioides sp. YIM 152315 TaxID=3031760 RepID=UPI0023DAA421|nr:DUF4091 domain-containing protein [Nocardioides sp. YIM 152315]MDF1602609.1 DUF4091 domain-containing protein [Nocardioides sp. YIM 152315]
MGTRRSWSFVLVDSLEKVFPDRRPRPLDAPLTSVFLGEVASFQLAFLPPHADQLVDVETFTIEVDGPAAAGVVVRSVDLVPVSLAAYDGHDEHYLSTRPGLFPDLLAPLPDRVVQPTIGSWRALWFDVCVDDPRLAGASSVVLRARGSRSGLLYEGQVEIVVHPHRLPALDIVNTHWLHVDSLAQYYDLPVFSEELWRVLDAFVAKASEMDATSVLTPTWTPPLDTAVGASRLPVQLIDIAETPHGYDFEFDKLGRWLEMCRRHGIMTIEIAHFFTQWGATATPAIYVETARGVEQRFGWHVPATSPDYRRLLEQLVPPLRAFLAEHWADGEVVYHVSDEPAVEMLAGYGAAREVVADLLEGCLVVDALSNHAFVTTGAVAVPVVATDAVVPFLENDVRPLWVYYCCAQQRGVANRFIAMPSVRNRALGHQLFAFRVAGFLHWGFNFYNAHHSTHPVDPFRDTCANDGFPGGDPFLVYPGPDGTPWESIRFRVFCQAMADHRALQLLRDLTDFETARALVDPDGSLAFDHFSYDPAHYAASREAVNARVVSALESRATTSSA